MYGIIRVFNHLSFNDCLFIIYFRIFGMVFISFCNFVNFDLKVFVAFSSIIYINISFLVVSLFNYNGILSFFLINLFHSFSSMIYFFRFGLFNVFSKSRLFVSNFGFVNICINLFYLFFIIIYLNLFSPFTLGFFGELFMFIYFFYLIKVFFYIICLVFIINLIYNVIYFVNIGFGRVYYFLYIDLKLRIYMIYNFVIFSNLFLFLKLDFFMFYYLYNLI